jgi:hypothetical protein
MQNFDALEIVNLVRRHVVGDVGQPHAVEIFLELESPPLDVFETAGIDAAAFAVDAR